MSELFGEETRVVRMRRELAHSEVGQTVDASEIEEPEALLDQLKKKIEQGKQKLLERVSGQLGLTNERLAQAAMPIAPGSWDTFLSRWSRSTTSRGSRTRCGTRRSTVVAPPRSTTW